ncbi:MAG: GNAT family N-acetyltransferase [Alphaproteobacteria bacterium]|nr:GNAT family N-acetyltransferase [Alphaproteobacteria bacterium]
MPWFRLESPRLLLRPPEAADVESITAQMGDWDVVKNLARAPYPYTEDHARAFLARQEEGRAKGADYAFAVTRKPDGALVGMCGVHLREQGFELGYWFGRAHWGQGYATEAAAEVLGFAFRNLRAGEVEAGWFQDNPASGRVLEKLGFRPDGVGLRDCAARGERVLCNLVIMSRAEFGQRQAA